MAEPVPTRVTYPSYPRQLIALENILGGMANYHTSASWLWIGAWHIIALVRTGHLEEAQKLVSRILGVIVQDRQVNEVHASKRETAFKHVVYTRSASDLERGHGYLCLSHIREQATGRT